MRDYRLSRKTSKGSLRSVLRNMHALSAASPRVIGTDKGVQKPRLQLHKRNVSNKLIELKSSQRLIQQTESARRIVKDRCLQSVMCHGSTATPDTKTFVQTFDDGRTQTWDEAIA